jgi:hypothetical protein
MKSRQRNHNRRDFVLKGRGFKPRRKARKKSTAASAAERIVIPRMTFPLGQTLAGILPRTPGCYRCSLAQGETACVARAPSPAEARQRRERAALQRSVMSLRLNRPSANEL